MRKIKKNKIKFFLVLLDYLDPIVELQKWEQKLELDQFRFIDVMIFHVDQHMWKR